jgi:hypothetical protein
MPIPLPNRRPPRRESFALKSMFVASALLLAGFMLAREEFRFSAPASSLSETEATLRLAR